MVWKQGELFFPWENKLKHPLNTFQRSSLFPFCLNLSILNLFIPPKGPREKGLRGHKQMRYVRSVKLYTK